MATINGLTAERLLALEADTVIGGHISGDDLILEQHDGSTINAGSVRGFPGISDMALYDPVGIPKPYMGDVAPTGYAICDASTEYDEATYPELAALFGTGVSCVNGPSTAGHFKLPDLRGKALVGKHGAITAFDTLHKTGGTKDAAVVTHDHSHNHGGNTSNGGVDHTHGISSDGAHSHSVDGGDFGDRILISYGSGTTYYINDTSGANGALTSLESAPAHAHGGGTGAASTYVHGHPITTDATSAGSSGTDQNLPPYRVINWIMRLA